MKEHKRVGMCSARQKKVLKCVENVLKMCVFETEYKSKVHQRYTYIHVYTRI